MITDMQTGTATLWVSYRQFWLLGSGARTDPPSPLPPMSFVQLRPDAAMITTGLSMGDIAVTVAQLDSAPNELDSSEIWEDILEFSLGSGARPPIQVVALEDSPTATLPTISTGDSAGPFRVRVHAIGRRNQAVPDAELPERYLIQSWESAQSELRVIRETCAPTGIVIVDRPRVAGGGWRANHQTPQTMPAADAVGRAWPTDRR